MRTTVIRPERYGDPETAFRTEAVDTSEVPPAFVLGAVMTSENNYKVKPFDRIRL
ncbi:hypothetical protein ACFYZB_46240 [Streptomyces sp. NPDC001852]|uniref:hypothetical protein n=1 Tax=Streptomyces sp. NPDC001852 TaxID=3364619 RepID=UPI0036927C34